MRFGATGLGWLLTASDFDAATALDAGLVNELVDRGQQLERAIEVAERLAANAPLAIQAALATARAAERASRDAAFARMQDFRGILTSEDAMEGVMALVEKRPPAYTGNQERWITHDGEQRQHRRVGSSSVARQELPARCRLVVVGNEST